MRLFLHLDEFKEGQHPRDPEGKFTKGGGYKVSSNLTEKLTAAGFKKVPGYKAFEHPSGIKLAIDPPEPGKTSSTNWTSYLSGKKPLKGKGTSFSSILSRAMQHQGAAEATKLPSSPTSKYMEPVEMGQLQEIGGQLGSNKGGVFVDPDGNKFYVKTPQSEKHAKAENLAANLYRLAGAKTLTYRNGGPDKVVTEWVDPDAKQLSQFTKEQRQSAKTDFAIHAWLANWDAVGANGDNQMVVNGQPITGDMGGSLMFRAQGKPKEFDSNPGEWDTLRDASKAPQAAALFGDMSNAELKYSAEKLQKITAQQINAIVHALGPGTDHEKNVLTSTLIHRRDAILAKANNLGKEAEYEPHPGIAAPPPTGAEKKAIRTYGGSGYGMINKALRDGNESGSAGEYIKELRGYLDKCKLKKALTLSRKVSSDYAATLKSIAVPGMVFKERGFMSTSTSMGAWGGSLQFVINAPEGSHGAYISHLSGHSSEKEVLFKDGYHLKVTKIEGEKMYVDLVDPGTSSGF